MAWCTSSMVSRWIRRCKQFFERGTMDLQLAKKIALVSGSTAGIGNAIATSLAREGATVIVNGRTSAAVDAAVAAMKSATGGNVIGFAGDLSVSAVAEKLAQAHPHVDILV